MLIYHRETDSTFKADVHITEDCRMTVHLYSLQGEDEAAQEYKEAGKHGVPLESHRSYSVLYSEDGYLIRDKENKQYRSKLKILPTNQVTMGSRMKYEEAENRYGGMVLMQVDTNTISSDVFELQVQLFRLHKDNVNFELLPDMAAEYVNLDIDDVFKNGSKRQKLWDTYSLIVDGSEYKASEYNTENLGTVSMADREYVEMEVQKYTNGFGEKLEREADNENVFIECTAGVANCQRVKLANGKAKFRWYNLGFTGEFKIKLGWRWYSGIADVRLVAE